MYPPEFFSVLDQSVIDQSVIDQTVRSTLSCICLFNFGHLLYFAGLRAGEAALGSFESGEDSDSILRRKENGMEAVSTV